MLTMRMWRKVGVCAFLIAICLITRANAEDKVTLETDRTKYKVGESVKFSGSGYLPSGTHYNITIVWIKKTEGIIERIFVDFVTFDSIAIKPDESESEEGVIPDDVTWSIPFYALDGTYEACVYNITNEGQFEYLASSEEFFINASEAAKLEYALGDLEELIGVIEGIEAGEDGLIQSLLSSLENAAKKVENATDLLADLEYKRAANQLRAARNMLTAFVHKVVAQTDRIGGELADELIQKAMSLLNKVDSLLGTLFEESVPAGKRLSINMRRTLAKQELGLNEYLLKKRTGEAEDDEALLAFLNSTIARLREVLNQTKAKRSKLSAHDFNLSEVAMELEDMDQITSKILHLWELIERQIEEKGKLNPGLAKKLSKLILETSEGSSEARETAKGLGKDLEEIRGKAWGRKGNPPGHGKRNGW